MSDLVATVVAGPAHPNSGRVSIADVVGMLYVGGSGMWRFNPVHQPDEGYIRAMSVSIRSKGDLADEVRAGLAVALNLGSARELAKSYSKSDVDEPLYLGTADLAAIGNEGAGLGVAMLVTAGDEHLAADLSGLLGVDGWSVTLCSPIGSSLETQWDSR